MALTEEQLSNAKSEAKKYLEYAVYTTALMLGVDIDEIDAGYVVPVDESHQDYLAYLSLASQVNALSKLEL
jgi:hypothetical protein